MTAYLDEEIETAGIHAASDFGLGEHTRTTLRGLGFPEPNDDGARVVAEKVLIPMVLATKKRYQPQAARILDAEQIRIDANITARRILWPNNPERYCEGAFELGMLAPDDCR
jgi:hypothetical protein